MLPAQGQARTRTLLYPSALDSGDLGGRPKSYRYHQPHKRGEEEKRKKMREGTDISTELRWRGSVW